MGPLRSWRIQLIRKIPKEYHLDKNRNWFKTAYDAALQHSLFEMAGTKRVVYIPEILYLYNKLYGGNDDSTA